MITQDALHEAAHTQNGRCAVCFMRTCKHVDEWEFKVRGLLCASCMELIELMPMHYMREEIVVAKKRIADGEKYSLDSGSYTHDIFTLRWALEYLEAAEGIGPDDPSLFYQGEPKD